MTIKCAILFSGHGSNMQNLIESLHNQSFSHKQGHARIEIALTLCNNKNAYGITRAHHLGIPCELLPHRDYASRESYDEALARALEKAGVEYVFLAGFMRILGATFTRKFKTINIHPSFLPAHKGAHAISDSYAAGSGGGVSVHWVNEELDSGEIILQERLEKTPSESLESFESRIHNLEYRLYPRAILHALHLSPIKQATKDLK